jgi:hypothetical protein
VTADFTPKPGQNIFRDVTTDPITGKPHKVKVCGPWLQFDEDDPIQLPEPGMHVRLFVDDGYKEALVRGHDTDHVHHVFADVVQDFGKIMGDYPAAFDADGRYHIQRDNSRADYASEGLHHIEPDGRWVMNNAPALNYRTLDGKWPILQSHRAGGWMVGKCDAAVNSGVVRVAPDGQIDHYPQYTQFPPFVNSHGWVAIQGSEWKMTPEPDAVPWIRHEDLPAKPGPIVTPPVVPPPPAPADCTAEREKIANLEAELREVLGERDDAYELGEQDRRRADTAEAALKTAMTPDQVLKLVNDATGQMAGYWRYLGVQGAVDRAVKAELARRK